MKSKIKILHMAPQLGKGGAEDILVNLSSHLSIENDVTVFVFSRYFEDTYNIARLSEKVKLRSFVSTKLSFGSKLDKIMKVLLYIFSPLISIYLFFNLKMYKFDIIHINMTISSFYLPFFKLYMILFSNSTTRFVETFHTNTHLLKPFARRVFKNSWGIVDHLIYEIGEFENKNILKSAKVKSISFIPFGVPKAENKDNSFCNNFCNKYNINKNRFIFLTIARVRLHEKKFDKILSALQKLKASGFDNFTYVICGDGPDMLEVQMLIDNLDLKDNVILTGYVDNPQQIVYIADLFLVAMVGHDTGIAGLQAGMAGIPLVGIQTLDSYDRSTDVIYSTSSSNHLFVKLKSLLDSVVLSDYGNRTTKYIQQKFDINKFYDNYVKLIEKLVE